MIPKQPTWFEDVPGFNNIAHNESLQQTVKMLKPNSTILEIGCAWGKSTWAILDAIKEGTKLHTVDTFKHLDRQKEKHYWATLNAPSNQGNTAVQYALEVFRQKNQYECWKHSISYHPKRSSVTVYKMPSQIFISKYANLRFDLVYLDGDHSFSAVSNELNSYKDSGIICGDDYHPEHPGVVNAVDKFLSENPDRKFWTDDRPKSGFFRITK